MDREDGDGLLSSPGTSSEASGGSCHCQDPPAREEGPSRASVHQVGGRSGQGGGRRVTTSRPDSGMMLNYQKVPTVEEKSSIVNLGGLRDFPHPPESKTEHTDGEMGSDMPWAALDLGGNFAQLCV